MISSGRDGGARRPGPGRDRPAARATRLLDWLNRSRRAHLVAALAFALMLGVYFAPALVGHSVFTDTATQQGYVYPWASTPAKYPFALQSDQSDLSMPALRVQQRAYDAGELPFVDLYSYGGGNALYADFATGQAYPPRIFVAELFDPLDAHLVFTLMHLFAAGFFTYLLVRRYRARWLAGIFAGSSWMLGGWTLAWMHLAPFLVISALLPAGLWAMHLAAERRTWRTACVCGALLGANVIAGQVLMGVVSAAIMCVYGLCLCGRRIRAERSAHGRSDVLRTAAVVPSSGAVAVGLWAFVLVPLAAARSDTARAPMTYAELTSGQLGTARDVLTALWPFPAPVDIVQFNAIAFVGLLTGLAALVGLCTRRPGAALGRGLLVVTAATMLGGPVTWLAFHLVPTMDLFRPYTRLALFLGFAVVLLAAAGFEALADAASRQMARRGRSDLRPFVFAAVAVLLAANAGHLMLYGRHNNPQFAPDDAAAIFPDTPFVTALRAAAADEPNGWPGRAVSISPIATPGAPWSPPMLFAANAAYIGVETASGYDSTMTSRAQRNLRVLTGESLPTVLQRDGQGAYIPEFWWMLARDDLFVRNGYDLVVTPPSLNSTSEWGRRHVATGELTAIYEGPDGNVYRIAGARPGPHGISSVTVAANDTDALATFTDASFDASASVVLSGRDATALAANPLPVAEIGDASRSVNGYDFTATAAAATLVVVPLNWNDGWAATVDGRDVPLMRGNYQQLVVSVPAGASHVRLRFRAPGFVLGAAVSGVTVVLLLVTPIGLRLRRLRRKVDG